MDDPVESVDEIKNTQKNIGDFVHPRRYFRPFGGGGALGDHLLSRAAHDHLCDQAYTCVTWNMIPRDWDGDQGWIQRAFDLGADLDWGLVVLHDVPSGAMQYLDEFLQRLKDENVEIAQAFPPDCQMIRDGAPQPGVAAYVAG
ncbi:MAG: hypothetical protein ACKVKG_06795 [Alphaproteobacteria bacterium]|jgi:hypothetical protein